MMYEKRKMQFHYKSLLTGAEGSGPVVEEWPGWADRTVNALNTQDKDIGLIHWWTTIRDDELQEVDE